jgi:rhamnosyltransferase
MPLRQEATPSNCAIALNPKVCVLLAAYNGAEWINEQVDSVLNQKHVEVHLIVSDDGSTDETRSRLSKYSSDPRVKIISPPRPTGSAAQNFFWMIRTIAGNDYAFLALADQDDIWCDYKLIRACEALNGHAAVGYSCASTAFWQDGSSRILRQAGRTTASDFLFEGAGQGCTYVLTIRFYQDVRNFLRCNSVNTSGIHYHDWAIYALSRVWNFGWVFDRQPMIKYRQHRDNDTGARSRLDGKIRRLSQIRNGSYAQQLRAIADLCMAASFESGIISQWRGLLGHRRGLKRKLKMVLFCLSGGRRRKIDKSMLIFAVVVGWI